MTEKLFRFALLILISLLLRVNSNAADTLVLFENYAITQFAVDGNKNFYVTNSANTLSKIDSNGKLITQVNIKSFGEVSTIDCSNPFEVYIYYQDQNIIVYYDNMLNLKGITRLNDLFLTNVSCIGRSYDNGAWLFDLTQYKLLKINKIGEISVASPNLFTTLGFSIEPYKIWEVDNSVYLADSLRGVYEFDIYGNYARTYYQDSTNGAIIIGNQLILKKSSSLIAQDLILKDPILLKLDVPNRTNLSSTGNTLYYSYKNKIISYPIN